MTVKILAIETGTPIGSAALLTGADVVAEATSPLPARHLEWLLPAIMDMLETARWRVEDVQGIAVSRGPGSFTGLRIGMATAAAWARTRNVPVVGISTLEAIAAGVDAFGTICVVQDARRGEYATAVFARTGGENVRQTPDTVWTLDAVLGALPLDGPVIFAGDALERQWTAIMQGLGSRAVPAPRDQWTPHARQVGRLGFKRLASGQADDPYLLLPAYTRGPVRE
ncbi:MAG TPA: tRNA (adenosine(37)-N6)-threonylcarbamoyltransferase complex dimerization subunit type 1 TsaB [bacterium]|jgi:tRNA threonylcarbamoyladenosine biosynthesis protein TsaB